MRANSRENRERRFFRRGVIPILAVFGMASGAASAPGWAAQLKVMKVGLGSGTVKSINRTGIDCGTDCGEGFGNVSVRLSATADNPSLATGSTFAGWEGATVRPDGVVVGWGPGTCPGTGECQVDMTNTQVVRARFNLNTAIDTLTACGAAAAPPNDCTPDNIRTFLTNNPIVTTPARFLAALPAEYKQNWILMPRSESLQTGTAKMPRLLLPSADTRFVFTIGMAEHDSFPGSHPNAVEYMQWHVDSKNFRFHEVILKDVDPMIETSPGVFVLPKRLRGVKDDDVKCTKCHTTRNVPNPSQAFGTTGRRIPPPTVIAKGKPNWDTYDSWGGMMPFNRDRIYQGSVEEKAFKALFNLWNWRGSDEDDKVRRILEQLETVDGSGNRQLQPPNVPISSNHRIVRNINNTTDAGHIVFGYEASGAPAAPNARPSPGNDTNYNFNGVAGSGKNSTVVNQEGRYVTLRHSLAKPRPGQTTINEDYKNPGDDEGRGVELFDRLTAGPRNPTRIADELNKHRFGGIDVRPIALAIAEGCIVRNGNTVESAPQTPPLPALSINFTFFNSRHGMTGVQDLLTDTLARQKTLPSRKADIQKMSLDRNTVDGPDANTDPDADPYLMTADLATTPGLIGQYASSLAGTIDERREEVLQRSQDLPSPDQSVIGGFYVDREIYAGNAEQIALYRYFLEPLGVSVDRWSMGVRGRSRTYTFADLFGGYTRTFSNMLRESLRSDLFPGTATTPIPCSDLIREVNRQLVTRVPGGTGVLPDPTVANKNIPTYTDVQRIFNKSCIECHGNLRYPPYEPYRGTLDLSETEPAPGSTTAQTGWDRLDAPYRAAAAYSSPLVRPNNTGGGFLYQKLVLANEDCPHPSPGARRGMMPCGGPPLSRADIQTIKRWINGGSTKTAGDPHIRTIDGIDYDFQADGEYVLLTGPGLEVQARHTAVETGAPYGPNGHTGLTSCVSVNGAVAVRVGEQRITYQPNLTGPQDEGGLTLRIDGEPVTLGDGGVNLAWNGRIVPTITQRGIRIEAPGGTQVIVTPNWWSSRNLWYMTIDVQHARGTLGLMGSIAAGNWLPAMPDGRQLGPRPEGLQERYDMLYHDFGEAWRVTDATSLFDYAPGTSSADFRVLGWPKGESPQNCSFPPRQTELPGLEPGVRPEIQPALPRAVAIQQCAGVLDPAQRENCIGDVSITGEVGFAETYLLSQEIELNQRPSAPVLVAPNDYAVATAGSVDLTWERSADPDREDITYRSCVWPISELYDANKCITLTAEEVSAGEDGDCDWFLALLAVLLFAVLVLLAMGKKAPALVWLAIGLLVALVLVYLYCDAKNGEAEGPITRTVPALHAGQSYYWKILAEDGKGGIVESETRVIDII